MQEKFLLAAYVESETLPNMALPRGTEFLIERVLNRGGGALVIAVGLELIKGGGAHLHCLVSHFSRHIRVLCSKLGCMRKREM
jgi:hypothetical protein